MYFMPTGQLPADETDEGGQQGHRSQDEFSDSEAHRNDKNGISEEIIETDLSSQAPGIAENETTGTGEQHEGLVKSAATGEEQYLTTGADELKQAQSAGGDSAENLAGDTLFEKESLFAGPRQPTGVEPVKVITMLQKDFLGKDLKSPFIVHYDSGADELYVVGGSGMHPSSTVTIFGSDYFPVASLGRGRGINSPNGLDLDEAGNIYMSQSTCQDNRPCLKVLNPAFFPVTEVYFSDIEGVPDTFQPRAVAVTADHIYLTGYFSKGVLVLDRDYNFVRWLVPLKIRGMDEMVVDDLSKKGGHFVDDVVIDESSRVYILSMEAGRIFVLDREWNFLFAFGEKGGSSAKLSQPRSLAVDEVRQVIYVVDYMRHCVNLYGYADGEYLFEIGGMGYSPGWFRYPIHVTIDDQYNLVVADYFNNRVQVLYVP